MDAQELASGELLLELVDAADRGLQAAFVGDEPDIVAVRLREVDLGPAQQDHALAADADDARRGASARSGGSRSIGSPCRTPKTASVPIGSSARKTGCRRDPAGLAAELGHDLRRADPVAVEHEPAWSRDGRGARGRGSGRQRTAGSSAGTRAGTPRKRLASSSAITTLPLASSAASAWPRPRSRLGEGRGQFGAAVAGALAQDRARAAHRLGQPPGRLLRKVGAPGRDVEDRDRVAGHGVANGDAGADPLVEARCTSARAR